MAVAATGFFDGVHLGHRQVIRTLVSSARERGEEAIVVTFAPHPRAVLQQDAHSLRLLNSPQEKEAMLRELGVDRVETLRFDRAFARLSAADYIRTVLIGRFGATLLVLGFDNRLGSDRLTPDSIKPLAESLGLEVIVVPPASIAGQFGSSPQKTSGCAGPLPSDDGPLEGQATGAPENTSIFGVVLPRAARFSGATAEAALAAPEPAEAVSSTKIRKALEEGNVEEAEAMLGYAYGLRGVVVSGKQLGRTLGFPTANLRLYDPMKLIPARGVYLTEVEVLGGQHWGMTNVGDIIETHIFDFSEDIYGLDLKIRFRRWLRAMRPFHSLDALKAQLAADEAACLALLQK
jgi:riboflavin kinase/FMN adenylyltransferase